MLKSVLVTFLDENVQKLKIYYSLTFDDFATFSTSTQLLSTKNHVLQNFLKTHLANQKKFQETLAEIKNVHFP